MHRISHSNFINMFWIVKLFKNAVTLKLLLGCFKLYWVYLIWKWLPLFFPLVWNVWYILILLNFMRQWDTQILLELVCHCFKSLMKTNFKCLRNYILSLSIEKWFKTLVRKETVSLTKTVVCAKCSYYPQGGQVNWSF